MSRLSAYPPMTRTPTVGCLCGYFTDPVYGARIHLLWTEDVGPMHPAAVTRYIKTVLCTVYEVTGHKDAHCLAVRKPGGVIEYVVALYQPWARTPDLLESLTHELYHACDWIVHDRGVPVVEGTANEAHAYFIGSLMRCCLELLMQKPKRLKKK